MNSAIDPNRLYTVLDRTNLRSKDAALYQLLYNLIDNLAKLVPAVKELEVVVIPGGTTTSIVSNNGRPGELVDNIVIEESYFMIGSQGSVASNTYDAPLTNGDPVSPEIIFDSNGDVVMVTGIPL